MQRKIKKDHTWCMMHGAGLGIFKANNANNSLAHRWIVGEGVVLFKEKHLNPWRVPLAGPVLRFRGPPSDLMGLCAVDGQEYRTSRAPPGRRHMRP